MDVGVPCLVNIVYLLMGLWLVNSLLKHVFRIIFIFVYIQVCVFLSVWVPLGPEEGAASLGDGVADGCKLSSICAGIQTTVRCKSSKLS